jgi:hypothetical protein
MSIPASVITLIALELTPIGRIPAEYASITSLFRYLAQPSAIWLRQELPVQINNTFIFSLSPHINTPRFSKTLLFAPLYYNKRADYVLKYGKSEIVYIAVFYRRKGKKSCIALIR